MERTALARSFALLDPGLVHPAWIQLKNPRCERLLELVPTNVHKLEAYAGIGEVVAAGAAAAVVYVGRAP